MFSELTQSYIWFRNFVYGIVSHHDLSLQMLDDGLRFFHSVLMRPLNPSHFPFDLQIEVTTACNLRCVMCKGIHPEKPGRHMSFEAFHSIVDQLPTLYRMVPQGVGEPLLNPDLLPMVEYVSNKGIAVEFNTNAIFLDASRATRLIDAGLYALTVSVDGSTPKTYEKIRVGARFTQVVANLQALRDIKCIKGTKLPRVRFNVVVMKTNLCEIPDILRLAHTLGVEMVILSPLQICSPAQAELVCELQEWQNLFRHVALARKLGIDLSVCQPKAHPNRHLSQTLPSSPAPTAAQEDPANVQRMYSKPIEETITIRACGKQNERNWTSSKPIPRSRRRSPCTYPWLSLYVTVDGYVMPCCWAQEPSRNHLGNLFEEDLASIWWGPKYQNFRRRLIDSALPLPEACLCCPFAEAMS